MNIKEAIEVLKDLKRLSTIPMTLREGIDTILLNKAIDTLVAEVEKPKYMADDMVDFAIWVKEGICKNNVGIRFNGEFVQFIEGIPVDLSNEQVVKLWEEQK